MFVLFQNALSNNANPSAAYFNGVTHTLQLPQPANMLSEI